MVLKVAIVGRPNVGKSTLFNRLAGKKLAIVDDLPGVTRDRREAQGRLGDLDLTLIDTAGFEDLTDESLEARMRTQTEAAIADADVSIFLVDARAGVTPLDKRFADVLRRSGKPVVLAANKCEGKAGESGWLEAFSLGFGEPVALSAEHGEGMSELFSGIVAASPHASVAEEPGGERPIRLAVVGRPNAGKSTLVNALIGDDRLLTGPEAGITRDAITVDWSWGGKRIRLVDTAGMRRKAKVQQKLEVLSVADTLRAIKFADVCALVMDQKEAFEKQDLAIADLVAREGRALVYVLAKWDQAEDPPERFKELRARAEEALPQTKGAPIVTVSAQNGRGLPKFMEAVLEVYGDWNARVKTSDLNNWLQHAITRHPPPAVNGKRIKPRFITQVKARPPTFVLMCSRATALPDSYKRYLVTGIREAFGLEGQPVRLIVRQNKNPFSSGEE
ncbi:MAG: ribosome biogenesis GTPase Der [Hyphomonadaceae bacterium]|nr:ribosome biogenesis GTPase Der [Hyphomonadaceae bacterium]